MALDPDPTSPDIENMDPEKEARQLLNPASDSQAKFSQGDVAIRVPARSPGVGMNKQELMKFAQDPFWVNLRLSLFILFWVVWVAMLVGAVAIIALAPGCPPTSSMPWWSKCSMSQVGVRGELWKSEQLPQVVASASEDLDKLAAKLSSIRAGNMGGIIITGLSPYLLHIGEKADNVTTQSVNSFKASLQSLVDKAHQDEYNLKIVVDLDVSSTPIQFDWFEDSNNNQSALANSYIWVVDHEKQNNTAIYWKYDTERFMYYASKRDQDIALINYEDERIKESIKRLVIKWIRTKIDGVQVHQGFYKLDSQKIVSESIEPIEYLHKQVKSTGEKKAFIVVNDGEARQRVSLRVDLQPNWDIYTSLSSPPLSVKLSELFKASQADDNITANVEPSKELNWKAWYGLLLGAKNNNWVTRHSAPLAEGLTAALYLLPKSSPVFMLDGDQLENGFQSNGTNSAIFKLAAIRAANLDAFLLGKTYVLDTGNSAVFAVYRAYKTSSSFLFVLNTDDLPRTLKLDVGYPKPEGHTAKVVLTDNTHAGDVDRSVDLAQVKVDPKQWLLVKLTPSG